MLRVVDWRLSGPQRFAFGGIEAGPCARLLVWILVALAIGVFAIIFVLAYRTASAPVSLVNMAFKHTPFIGRYAA